MAQVEVLLTPVMDFNSDTGDTGYTVSVVSLIKDSIQLSCRPGTMLLCLLCNLRAAGRCSPHITGLTWEITVD